MTEAVCSRVREHLGPADAELAEAFVRQYYRWVAPDDLAEREPARPVRRRALALQLRARAQARRAQGARLQPAFDVDGWQSTHTAVEIVADDMPFLIDSVSMELNRGGYGVHLIIHPVMASAATTPASLIEILPPAAAPSPRSPRSPSRSSTPRSIAQTDPDELAGRAHIERVLGEVRAAVEDWPDARRRWTSPPTSTDRFRSIRRIDEAAFLEWLEDTTSRSWATATTSCDARWLAWVGLSILHASRAGRGLHGRGPRPRCCSSLTKANSRATVHRPAYLDYVGVKRFDADGGGRASGASSASTRHRYRATRREIPILRRKVEAVLARAAFPHGTHNEKALIEILETYPRDELFQIGVGRAVRHGHGDPAPGRAPAAASVRAPRPLRALPLLPGLRPARPLQHGQPPAHRAHPARGLRRRASTTRLASRSRCSCACTT